MIPKFLEWCKKNKLNLPELDENQMRSGIRPQYPDGYVRSQYPGGYFQAISSTAGLDLANAKKVKSSAPSDNAP